MAANMFCLVQLLMVINFNLYEAASQESYSFSNNTLCNFHQQLSDGCIQSLGIKRSNLECAAECAKNSSCAAYSFNTSSSYCYIHYQCALADSCDVEDRGASFYRKNNFLIQSTTMPETSAPTTTEPYCMNEGSISSTPGAALTCSCTNGWVGERCERHAISCMELYTYGYAPGSHYVDLMPPKATRTWRAFCRMSGTQVRTYAFYNSGRLNFNRTWEEYVNGFEEDNYVSGDPYQKNMWAGLEFLHLTWKENDLDTLVVSGYFLYFSGSNKREGLMLQTMNGAKVDDAGKQYELDFSDVTLDQSGVIFSSSTIPGDCMTISDKQEFSTWDSVNHDTDLSENFAAQRGSGWWFAPTGSFCNLLGNIPIQSSTLPLETDLSIIDLGLNYLNHAKMVQMYFVETIPE